MRWPSRPERPGRHADAGTVVAEFAVALPGVVLVLACCLGALRVGVEQVRLGDASASAARMLGRGDPLADAEAVIGTQSSGRLTDVVRQRGSVCVTAASSLRIAVLLAVPISERSCALDDPA
jgi:hypothetical protein